MPTVLRVGPYRFLFYASDQHEPAHIHVEREDSIATFCLDPVRLHTVAAYRESRSAGLRSS
jgi:hypothetical protein